MPTPYEEISNEYNSRNAIKTDANLAVDSMKLGGIAAEDYATKVYVQEKDKIITQKSNDYTDTEISKLKEEMKSHVKDTVDNIDYSDFATKGDLNAIETKLTNHCNTSCATSEKNAKAYTDTKYNELFQSVSDGKALVAGAITDKNVPTSANDSFSTMASNIKRISTSSLDTSNATAYESDIRAGKIAYGRGRQIVGTLNMQETDSTIYDTSDANATPASILQGYSAYVNGTKIHGTYVPEGEGSEGGIVLADNEVVATKVLGGYGAFVGGKSNVDSSIEQFYWDSSTELNITNTTRMAYVHTKNFGDFIIADRRTVEIYGEKELVIYNVSNNNNIYHKDTTQKYSFSYEELGIDSASNLCGIYASPKEYYSGVVTIAIILEDRIKCFLFDGSVNGGNGAIGITAPGGSTRPIFKDHIDLVFTDFGNEAVGQLAFANVNPKVLAWNAWNKLNVVELVWTNTSTQDYVKWTDTSINGTAVRGSDGQIEFNGNDSYIVIRASSVFYVAIVLLDSYYKAIVTKYICGSDFIGGTIETSGQVCISSNGDYMIMDGCLYRLYGSIIDETITYTKLSDVNVIEINLKNLPGLPKFDADDNYIYVTSQVRAGTSSLYYLYLYRVNFNNVETPWEKVSSCLIPMPQSYFRSYIDAVNRCVIGYNATTNEGGFYVYRQEENARDVIGLKYNGEIYYK